MTVSALHAHRCSLYSSFGGPGDWKIPERYKKNFHGPLRANFWCRAEPSECSSVPGTPRSAAAWGGGRGMMAASPRQSLWQQARLSALEACPVFLQVRSIGA